MNPLNALTPEAAEKLMRMPSAMVAHTVQFAVARGVPWPRITEATGLEPRDLVRADAWLPGSVVPLTWRLVAELCPGDAPALDLARAAPLKFLGEMVHGMRFGGSLRQVLDMARAFPGLTSDGLTLSIVESEHEVALGFSHVTDALDRGYGAEAGLGVAWRMLTEWIGGADDVLRVDRVPQTLVVHGIAQVLLLAVRRRHALRVKKEVG